MKDSHPLVFISYARGKYDVIIEDIARRLQHDGVEVIFDKWDLAYGTDIHLFMEKIHNPEVDKVLIMCDKTYVDKANSRSKGVGAETTIITPEFYNNIDSAKFIPLILENDEQGEAYCPIYLKSLYHFDFSNEDIFEITYEDLIRDIHKAPKSSKPPLGDKPAFLFEENTDYVEIRSIIRDFSSLKNINDSLLQSYLLNFEEEFSKSFFSFRFETDVTVTGELLLKKARDMSSLRDLYLTFLEDVIKKGFDVGQFVIDILTKMNNMFKESWRTIPDSKCEHFAHFLWSLMISTVSLLYDYKRYDEIGYIVGQPYFLNTRKQKVCCFISFYSYTDMIDKAYKNEKGSCWSPSSEILFESSKRPHFTKEKLAFADVLLAQLSVVYDFSDREGSTDLWFPQMYKYDVLSKDEYSKLISKKNCESKMRMFNSKDLEELRHKLDKGRLSNVYFRAWVGPCTDVMSVIGNSEEIGKY